MKLTRRNITVFIMAVTLVVLVQLIRFDLLLDIRKIENNATFEYKPKAESLLSTAEKEQFAKKRALLLAGSAAQAELDNLKLVLDLLQFEVNIWQTKNSWPQLNSYDLLIVFDKAGLGKEQTASLLGHVAGGGKMLVLGNGSSGPASLLRSNQDFFGIKSLGPELAATGLDFKKEVLAGLEGPCDFVNEGQEHASLFLLSQVALADKCHLLASDLVGNPLIWQLKEKGQVMVINNSSFASRRLRGLVTGAISLLLETVAYPVAGTAVFQIIDLDFGNDSANQYINQHYKRSFSQYLQHVWWPDMASLMSKYNLRYTVAYLGYDENGETKKAAANDAFSNLSRLVLRSQGEISYQGLPSSLGQSSQISLTNLANSADYLRQSLPNYQVRAYVKSEAGLADQLINLVEEKLPDIRIISGSYLPLDDKTLPDELQELKNTSTGTVFFPRVTYSQETDDCLKFDLASVITSHGLVSHAIRADEICNKPWQEPDWASLENSYSRLASAYPWLANDTISTGAAKLEQAGNLDVYYEQEADKIRLAAGNGAENPTLLLFTEKTITGASGCSWQRIDSVRYLVTMEGKTAFLEVE